MDHNQILEFLNQHGLWIIFFFEFAEYLNLPGFPATPLLLAIGVWAGSNDVVLLAILISIIGGQAGTVFLYFVGKIFGHPILTRYFRKFPKQEEKINFHLQRIEDRGPLQLTIVRLVPVVRTLITIPCGMLEINFKNFFWYSLPGIALWNTLFILAGSTAGQLWQITT